MIRDAPRRHGRPRPAAAPLRLRVLAHDIAEKTARELEDYPDQAERHFSELKAILDEEGVNYAT